MCLFIHSFIHSLIPSLPSLLATTVNEALNWALSESERDHACSQPFRSSQLGRRDERRGMKKNAIRVTTVHVIEQPTKLGSLREESVGNVFTEGAASDLCGADVCREYGSQRGRGLVLGGHQGHENLC